MEQPTGKYTIAEAAELWISLIQSPATKATTEQKAALIGQIQAATPIAKISGVGCPQGAPADTRVLFVDACNAIKRAIRSGVAL